MNRPPSHRQTGARTALLRPVAALLIVAGSAQFAAAQPAARPGAPAERPAATAQETLYSYETEYGAVKFYNASGNWPVFKQIKFGGLWHSCAFWARRHKCQPQQDDSQDAGISEYGY